MFDYDKFFNENPVNIHDQPERHAFVASLCKGHVCDIGCGTGSLSDYYRHEYSGFDISPVAIQKAEENRRSDTDFTVCDFNICNKFDFSKYNTIVLAEFLEHIEKDDHIFRMIKETAKVGTQLIISVPNSDRVQSPDHVREFTVKKLREKLEPLGDVHFQKWVGDDRRIIVTVNLKIWQKELLTLGIVAKDEGKGIEKCILSALNIVDKIIVLVDDSTTDETKKIAEKYTKEVFVFKWKNDFSAARNELLHLVQTPWVLFLDGHEYIEVGPSVNLGDSGGPDAYMVQNRLENGVTVRFPRLHRSELRYEDAVHNRLVCHNLGIDEKITMVHDRVGGQTKESTKAREKQRHEMITEIMGKELKRSPKNTRAAMHLGLHFHARHEHKKAIKLYKQYLKYSTFAGERWFIRWNMVHCFLQLGKNWKAEFNALALDNESPGRWESRHVLGIVYMAQKEYTKAVESFVNSFENNSQEAEYKPIKRDSAITWNLIGECYFRLCNYESAGHAFKRGASVCQNDTIKKLMSDRSKLMNKIFIDQSKNK